jgi:hypothetical protein
MTRMSFVADMKLFEYCSVGYFDGDCSTARRVIYTVCAALDTGLELA